MQLSFRGDRLSQVVAIVTYAVKLNLDIANKLFYNCTNQENHRMGGGQNAYCDLR